MLNVASSVSQIDKPQSGRPKRAELPDVNINTGAQSINTERASLHPKYPDLQFSQPTLNKMYEKCWENW